MHVYTSRNVVSSTSSSSSSSSGGGRGGRGGVGGKPVARRAQRVKLRAREHARLRCQNLELDIMNLRQEIATLETLRKLLYARALRRADDTALGSFEKIVREFYALSDGGYYDVVWRDHARSERVDMVQFMRANFDDRLAIGDAAETPPSPRADGGLASFVAKIKESTVVLDAPRAQVQRVQVHRTARHEATVVVSSRCTSTLTTYLLDALFAHLRAACPSLRDKLLGRQMATDGEGRYTFDVRTGRIVRVDLRFDYAAAILELAESMEELWILEGCAQGQAKAGERWENECEYGNQVEREPPTKEDDTPEIRSKSSGSRASMSLLRVLSPDDEPDDESDYERQDTP